MADEKKKDIGALWARESKKGDRFLTGHVTVGDQKVEIVVFKNGYKSAENQPDYRIYLSEPREAPKPSLADDIPPF